MSNSLPEGITSEHLLQAMADIDAGIPHRFADSTGYDVVFNGRRYPPKAVVGIAAERILGTQLGPADFTGGLRSKCFRTIEGNGFVIVTKGDKDPFPDELVEDDTFREGQVQTVTVNRYERDPSARKKCVEKNGSVCTVCLFDFSERYGIIGEGFIHVHHLRPLSDIGNEYELDPVKDLAPVCPNCHAMLHKRKPPFSPDELKELMSSSNG